MHFHPFTNACWALPNWDENRRPLRVLLSVGEQAPPLVKVVGNSRATVVNCMVSMGNRPKHPQTHYHWIDFREDIYRKPWFLQWNMVVSCKLSRKPIQWHKGPTLVFSLVNYKKLISGFALCPSFPAAGSMAISIVLMIYVWEAIQRYGGFLK